jgi:hypothetical protein
MAIDEELPSEVLGVPVRWSAQRPGLRSARGRRGDAGLSVTVYVSEHADAATPAWLVTACAESGLTVVQGWGPTLLAAIEHATERRAELAATLPLLGGAA